jgi:proliferating cell nuclear antigen
MGKIFEITTIKANIIKTLVEAMRSILKETTFSISKKGIHLSDMDCRSIIMAKMFLQAEDFDDFKVYEDIDIGIDMITFHNILKRINTGDILVLSMDTSNRSELNIRIDNNKNGSKTNSSMKLCDFNTMDYDIECDEYESVITMPAIVFQQICRDAKDSNKIVITKSMNELKFQCDFEGSSTEVIFPIEESELTYIKNEKPNDIFRGEFLVDPLISFIKCTTLSTLVELSLSKDKPLVVTYAVASLGKITLCLAQRIT